MTKKWLSTKDLAERFGKTVRTIREWTRRGILPQPVTDPGGHLRWDLKAIEKWEKTTYATYFDKE